MQVNGQAFRTIWQTDAGGDVAVIDQTVLPFAFEVRTLRRVEDAATAIRDMVVRGAPLIGVTAAYGVALALREIRVTPASQPPSRNWLRLDRPRSTLTIDYKKTDLLRKYITEEGNIRPRRQTGACAKHQRIVAEAVKQARFIALLPYTGKHWEESR